MAWNITKACLLSLSLAALALTAAAQGNRSTSIRDLPLCQSTGNASRVREQCEHEPITVTTESEKEVTISITAAPAERAQCRASVATEYLQSDTLVNVAGTIEVEGCAAATGEYTIAARVVDENGQAKTLEFSETWQRDDDRAVTFKADYPIGENVELLNVRARVRCACADQGTE